MESRIGHGTNIITDAIGHGKLSFLQTLQMAALFENHSPLEMRKTESKLSNLFGISLMISQPSALFCPTNFTRDSRSLVRMNSAHRLHLLH